MEKPILKDKEILPSKEVLEEALKSSFSAFEELNSVFLDLTINLEWNYYNDGKVWLGKMMFKKKNMGWISIFDGYFIATFYFTEKHLPAIDTLGITDSIKEDFYNAKPCGRLIPMSIRMYDKEPIEDVSTIIKFKKSLK